MNWIMKLGICVVISPFWQGYVAAAAGGEGVKPPVKIAIVGLIHGHVRGFIPLAMAGPEVEVVGIVEANHDVVAKYTGLFHLDPNLFYPSIEALLAKKKVTAVAAFSSTFDHRRVVEQCASHGIHVMMEKPLAVNMEHARAMEAAAHKGGIQVIVNYETTWYAGNAAAFDLVCKEKIAGDIRKIAVHDGHSGPRLNPPEFVKWLTDPVLNGGGALTDFGCYGADLMTWLMQGQRPTSVFAVTQQLQPEYYPKVDDEATIVLTYPHAQGIIQASWNWPIPRKDIEIYCQSGYVLVLHKDVVKIQRGKKIEESEVTPPALQGARADSISYLAAVARGEIQPSGLSSLGVNLIVTEILDAARESARSGRRIDLPAIPAVP